MAAETDGDRLDYFSTDDFGETATFASPTGAVVGIFDNEAEYVDRGGFGVEIESNRPTFLCRSSDVSAVAHNDTVTISGTSYVVRKIMPDGTGMTELHLAEAS